MKIKVWYNQRELTEKKLTKKEFEAYRKELYKNVPKAKIEIIEEKKEKIEE